MMPPATRPPATIAGYGRDRLVQSVGATANSNGAATFTIGPAPLGYVWEFTVQIPAAPTGTQFAASALGSSRGTWVGPTNFGPIQLYPGESLVVSAVGLAPATVYGMVVQGISIPDHLAEPISPSAPLSAVHVETATVLVGGVVISAANGSVTFKPPPLTRRLTFAINPGVSGAGTATVAITGTTTGIPYYKNSHYSVDVTTGVSRDFAEIEPALDPTMTLSVNLGGGNVTVWVLASFSNPLVKINELVPTATLLEPVNVYPTVIARSTQLMPVANTVTVLLNPPLLGESYALGIASIHNTSGAAAGIRIIDGNQGDIVNTTIPNGGFCIIPLTWRTTSDISILSTNANTLFTITYGLISVPI